MVSDSTDPMIFMYTSITELKKLKYYVLHKDAIRYCNMPRHTPNSKLKVTLQASYTGQHGNKISPLGWFLYLNKRKPFLS